MAIPYAVTKSVFFFALATLLVGAGYICCLLGQCSRHRRLFTFVSGVVFVVSGLVMLLGLIMYISVFKSEVGSKLRAKSQLQPPIFNYRYGYSFLLYLSGIVASELAGLSAIFLFICRMQETFRLENLEDVKLGKAGPSSVNYLQVDQAVFYPCQRHPQAYINSNSSIHVPTNFPSPVQNRRYFFDKQQVQESPTCAFRRERSSHTNSLKDISASYFDFPPPPTISYQFEEMKTFNRDTTRSTFPRDVTTNTVSTTADINCEEFFTTEHYNHQYSPYIGSDSVFISFDREQPLPHVRTQSTLSVSSRAENDYNSDSLKRTTPV